MINRKKSSELSKGIETRNRIRDAMALVRRPADTLLKVKRAIIKASELTARINREFEEEMWPKRSDDNHE